jgi:flagellar biosynthesis protein FlhF
MVVKKFEARSMKEALDMIKAEMGPEAIIIAGRDNSKRYGLVGEGSVEITAAIQPDRLQKKILAESKIPADLRDKIHRGSAKAHKEMIDKSSLRESSRLYELASNKTAVQSKSKIPIDRKQRYIDIEDDVEPAAAPNGTNEKLKMAAQRAWSAMQVERASETNSSLTEMRTEINDLREIFKTFRDVPQTMVQGHPGSEFGLKYELASAFERLVNVGISIPIVVEILRQVQDRMDSRPERTAGMIQGLIAQALAKRILLSEQSEDAKFEIFVGAGGHGKTSTLIKWAADLTLNEHKRVAILTTDSEKFGAPEQLKIYSQILNIPFMIVAENSDWSVIAEEAAGFDKILVDTPGVRFRVADEIQKLKQLLPPATLNARVHLVLSATAKDQDAIELGKRFSTIGYSDVIFTALDESFQHGVLLNFQEATGKPFHSFGIGPRVPEDFEFATRERILDLLLEHTNEIKESSNLNP